jgi:GNAT superfamily N-acetyltransferase
MAVTRTLNKNDKFDDLLQLTREFFMEYRAHHPYFFEIDRLSGGDIEDYFLSFCEHETRKAFIAVEEVRIIGYLTAYIKEQASFWQIKQVGEISGLMVKQNYRHQGIAARLLHDAEAFFASHDVRYYTTFTSINNHGALDFYYQMGMSPLSITLLGELEES